MFLREIFLLMGLILSINNSIFTMQKGVNVAKDDLTMQILNSDLNILYESKDNSEFVQSLVKLLISLKESQKDILAFFQDNLDIAKIDLFKNYREQFALLCDQESALKRKRFLDAAKFSMLRDLKDLLEETLKQVEESLKSYPEKAPENRVKILEQIKTSIINSMFYLLFEQFNTKNCVITIYKILDVFGLEILDSDKFQRKIAVSSVIDIKRLIQYNNKLINSELYSLVPQLIYQYLSFGKYDELIPLFDRLSDKGFAKELVITSFAHAIAKFLKNDAKVDSLAKAMQIASVKKEANAINAFIGKDIMKSNYRFDNYTSLIDQYIRTYTLMNYLQAKFDYDFEVEALLNQGVQLNAIDYKGNSPLLYAINRGNLKYVELLVDQGADVNLAGRDGITPLMKAILKNEVAIIKFLLERSTSLMLKDIYGDDVWSFAKHNLEITNLLKDTERNIAKQQLNIFKGLSFSLNLLALK